MARSPLIIACVLLIVGLSPEAGADTPADGWVVWASNRADGRHEIYLARADGSDITRMTTEGAHSATWSPDGAWIAFTRSGDRTTHVIRPDRSETRMVCEEGLRLQYWMLDGSGLVCGGDDIDFLVDPDTGAKQDLYRQSSFTRLGQVFWRGGITRDGRWLMGTTDRINETYTYDNGTFTTKLGAAVLLDLTDTEKIYFIGPGCEPTPSPVDGSIFHVSWESESTYPDIYRLDLADLATRGSYAPEMNHPDADWGHEYMPRFSTDGKWLAYGATTGCHDHHMCDYELFIHRVGAGPENRTRITHNPANDQWPHLYVGKLWPPRLQLEPTTIELSAHLGTAPDAADVAVRNVAGGTLSEVRGVVDDASTDGWLRVTKRGIGNSQSLRNTVDTKGLQPGRFDATITVFADNALGSPQTYRVVFVLDEAVPQPMPHGGCHFLPMKDAAGGVPITLLVLLAAGLWRQHPTAFRAGSNRRSAQR